MKRLMNLLLGLTVVSLFSLAFAQGDVQGIPSEYSGVVTVVIGLLSSILVQPLTAIAKKLGRTSGPTTVMISAFLSLLVAYGFAVSQALATGERVSFLNALFVALIAFAKSNGDYINRVFTNAKGNEISPPAAPAPLPAPGLEPLPLDKGSGVEPIPPAALGLLDVSGMLGSVSEDTLTGLIKTALQMAGVPVTDDRVLKVGLRLAKVAPDLMDGNAHLSNENRLVILNAVLDLKKGEVI